MEKRVDNKKKSGNFFRKNNNFNFKLFVVLFILVVAVVIINIKIRSNLLESPSRCGAGGCSSLPPVEKGLCFVVDNTPDHRIFCADYSKTPLPGYILKDDCPYLISNPDGRFMIDGLPLIPGKSVNDPIYASICGKKVLDVATSPFILMNMSVSPLSGTVRTKFNVSISASLFIPRRGEVIITPELADQLGLSGKIKYSELDENWLPIETDLSSLNRYGSDSIRSFWFISGLCQICPLDIKYTLGFEGNKRLSAISYTIPAGTYKSTRNLHVDIH